MDTHDFEGVDFNKGITSLDQGTPFNNPIGGVDQYAREMEALEKARAGETLKANELGGTLQDFYTKKQPLAPNKSLQVYDDNINFNDNVPSDKEDLYSNTEDYMAKVVGPALFQMRVLEKKDAMSEYGGEKLTPKERLKLDKLKKMDADPDKVYNKILIG